MEAPWSDEQEKSGGMVGYPGCHHVRVGLRSKATPIACLRVRTSGEHRTFGSGLETSRPTNKSWQRTHWIRLCFGRQRTWQDVATVAAFVGPVFYGCRSTKSELEDASWYQRSKKQFCLPWQTPSNLRRATSIDICIGRCSAALDSSIDSNCARTTGL
jgi:hypothetical protein